jgi:hypothetical protein
MPPPTTCRECRESSRELADFYLKALEAREKIDPDVLKEKFAEWRAHLVDGEIEGRTLPIVAPEILDLKQPPVRFKENSSTS